MVMIDLQHGANNCTRMGWQPGPNQFLSGCDDRPRDPYDQLSWARKELEVAREAQERVIIAGHVPPGNKVGSNNFCSQHLLDLEDPSMRKNLWNKSSLCVLFVFLVFLLLFWGGEKKHVHIFQDLGNKSP